MTKFHVTVMAGMAAYGCAATPEPEISPEITNVLFTSCPKSECGDSGNSPVIDGVYFWNLHSGKKENNQHVVMLGARKNGVALKLIAGPPGDRLIAVDPTTDVPLLTGTMLEHTRIDVLVKGKPYQIWIEKVSPSWAQDSFWVSPQLIETYDFAYAPITEEDNPRDEPHDKQWLCSLANQDPQHPMIRAIVFEGDVYDPDTKAITIGPRAAGWFNIACENGAPYKMHKIGHTSVAQSRLGIVTSLDKRRAMLNAWTANVCGKGEVFTHPGEPITIREQPDLLPWTSEYMVPWASHEAVWGPGGALCLDVPRLWEEDSEIRSKIQTACGGTLPPPCTGFPIWPLGDRVLTGNPDGE